MIYVTVGTMFMGFPRLIKAMDAIAERTGERIVIQTGLDETIPEHCEHFAFKNREGILALHSEARLVVCHAGIGSILDALEARRPFVVVPRRKHFKEHMNDHQLDIGEAVRRRGWGALVLDTNELTQWCASPPPFPADYSPARKQLVSAIRRHIDAVAARRG